MTLANKFTAELQLLLNRYDAELWTEVVTDNFAWVASDILYAGHDPDTKDYFEGTLGRSIEAVKTGKEPQTED